MGRLNSSCRHYIMKKLLITNLICEMFYLRKTQSLSLQTVLSVLIIVYCGLIIHLASKVLHLYYPYYRNIL